MIEYTLRAKVNNSFISCTLPITINMSSFAQFFVLAVLILKLPQPGECEDEQAIFDIKKEKYLPYHVIETKQADSVLECAMHCLEVKSCVSVNYKTSGVGKGLCELNNKTLLEVSDGDGRIHHPEFVHLYIIETVRT